MKALTIIILITTIWGAHAAQASIAFRNKDFSSQKSKSSENLDLKLKERTFIKKGRKFLSQEDIAKIVPTNQAHIGNSEELTRQLLTNTTNNIMKSALIQKSILGKTVNTVQQSTKMGIAIKGNSKHSAQKEIDHKVDFQIQAVEQEAKLRYQGYVDSKLEYLARDGSINLTIEEQLTQNSKIALTHRTQTQGTEQMVNFEMNW